MLGATAVARITYKQLKGDEFYSSRDAWKFVKKHWHAPVFTHLSIIIIAAFFVVMAIIFALIGKIPYLGELFFGIPYLLWFAGSVFVVYTMVVLMISTFFTHAIVGAMEEDTMGAVFQTYSITWSQIWRVLLYLPLIYSLVAIGTVVFYFFMTEGYNLVNCIFGKDWLMGDKLARMIGWVVGDTFMAGPATLLAWEAPDFFLYEPEGTMEYIGGAFIAISLFVIFWAILSYALCVKVAGQTIALVIFKNALTMIICLSVKMKKNWRLKKKLKSGLLKSITMMMKKEMILMMKNLRRVQTFLLILKKAIVHRTKE